MITDHVVLAGPDAYLKGESGTNLAGGSYPNRGRHAALPEGVSWELVSLGVYLEATGLLDLFRRHDKALLRLELRKEIFPELFRDPFATRVHTVAGHEDLRRGGGKGISVVEVDGVPTLVSTVSGACGWNSAVYRMTRAVELDGAAWDLSLSRLAPSEALSYSLELRVWTGGADPAGNPSDRIALATDRRLPDSRFTVDFRVTDVTAYQLSLRAEVRLDGALWERHGLGRASQTLGQPLLSAFYLMEPVGSPHDFYSLSELVESASEVRMPDAAQPDRMYASLVFPAALSEGESVDLVVESDAFRWVEAKLHARESVRAPTSRTGG